MKSGSKSNYGSILKELNDQELILFLCDVNIE